VEAVVSVLPPCQSRCGLQVSQVLLRVVALTDLLAVPVEVDLELVQVRIGPDEGFLVELRDLCLHEEVHYHAVDTLTEELRTGVDVRRHLEGQLVLRDLPRVQLRRGLVVHDPQATAPVDDLVRAEPQEVASAFTDLYRTEDFVADGLPEVLRSPVGDVSSEELLGGEASLHDVLVIARKKPSRLILLEPREGALNGFVEAMSSTEHRKAFMRGAPHCEVEVRTIWSQVLLECPVVLPGTVRVLLYSALVDDHRNSS
jgi:hypothetical protein